MSDGTGSSGTDVIERTALVCLMARAPVAGQVKRRLAVALGEQGALAAYERLLGRAIARAHESGIEAELWLTGPHTVCERVARDARLPWRRQTGEDLGARMLAIVESAHARARTAIVVGTDLPPVDGPYLQRAARALATSDVVIGPAEDGGYGLIAMRSPQPHLFAGIRWGAASVCAETLARAADLDLRVGVLPAVWDVDDLPGWERFLGDQAI